MARTKKEKEVKETINLDEIKEELQVYIDKEIKKGLKGEVDKANRRLLNEKNKKIYFRDIIIVLLLLVIVCLLYALNSVNYFERFFVKNSNTKITDNTNTNNTNTNNTEDKKEPTLSELVNTYGYLLNDIYINETDDNLKDYYTGNLTTELKKYLVLNTMDFTEFNNDDYSIIEEETFKTKYNKLFDGYESGNFSYNGNKIKYVDKLESYISTELLKKVNSNIKREIIDIKVDNNIIYVTTVEGILKDNKLYNILTDKEVKKYNNDELSKYKDSLNVVKYVFKDNKLMDIE